MKWFPSSAFADALIHGVIDGKILTRPLSGFYSFKLARTKKKKSRRGNPQGFPLLSYWKVIRVRDRELHDVEHLLTTQ